MRDDWGQSAQEELRRRAVALVGEGHSQTEVAGLLDVSRQSVSEWVRARLGVPAVATGNVHAHTQMRALLQDAFVAARHGLTLDASEVQRRPNHTHVMASPQAMAARVGVQPAEARQTCARAESGDGRPLA
jgi:DNA polymerase III alpha subunit